MIEDVKKFDVQAWLKNGTLICSGPGRVLVAWGSRQWLSDCKSIACEPLFYFPSFSLEESSPWFVQPNVLELTTQDLVKAITESSCFDNANLNKSGPIWKNPYLETFTQAFSDLQTRIQAKELDKAVPYAFEYLQNKMSPVQLTHSLAALLLYTQENPVYIYGFWDQNQGILGATPELLFELDGPKKIATMACAGTIEKGKSAHTFMQDSKEIHEHQLVIQGIKKSLNAYGSVHIGHTQLLELTRLSHLMTPIEVDLDKPATFEQIVHDLHPTPALGAFPRDAGMQWLKKYQEVINRHRFGAPAGYFFPLQNQGLCYVAIRNVQWDENRMCIGAGCGVVAESQCKKEWNEINLKLRSIKEMLAL